MGTAHRQEMLIDIPSPSLDEKAATLLEWLCKDPATAGDYRLICTAVIKAARERHDVISANDVRKHLVDADGALRVTPSRMGSTFRRLCLLNVLTPLGWVASTDYHGRNGGKGLREYRFHPDKVPNMEQ